MDKSFEEFRKYLIENVSNLNEVIDEKVNNYIDENDYKNLLSYTTAYTQMAIMKYLEEYHKWLNS